MKILIVEDDRTASAYLAQGLQEFGHAVEQSLDGADGLFRAKSTTFDILIVDRMLPKLDGLALIQSLRQAGIATPVLIISALDQVDERIQGLRAGGDDYLTKPYHLTELHARIEALARRPPQLTQATHLKVADLELDLLSRRVRRAGQRIDLTSREFKLLEFLMRHAGQVVTRTMILEGVWDYQFDPKTNVIDVHVSRLRQKIDANFGRALLHTVRGAGFTLCEETDL
jgi:two-component system OmpR family response regulator